MQSLGHRVSAVVLATTLALCFCGCQRRPAAASGKGSAASGPIPVTLVPVVTASVDRTVDVTGTLFADEDALIAAKVPGRVMAIAHDVGDLVEPGALIVQLDERDNQLELDRSRAAAAAALARLGLIEMPGEEFDPSAIPTVQKAAAEAANAQAKFERAQQLVTQSPPLIAAQDFADIQTARDVAKNQADVEILQARANLADARALVSATAIVEQRVKDAAIRAPRPEERPDLRYRVAERLVSVGEYVDVGRPVMRLVASDVVKFRAKAPERYAGSVRVGAQVRVASEGQTKSREGTVSRIAPAVDPQNRTFIVEVLVDNADGVLKPGAFARGSVVIGRDEAVTFVPADAVTTFAGISRVYSVQDGKVVEHRVELGIQREGKTEVIGPMKTDRVVAPVPPGLAPGVAVTTS